MVLERLFILESLNQNFFSSKIFLFARCPYFNSEEWVNFRSSYKNKKLSLFMLKNREVYHLFKNLIHKNFLFDSSNLYLLSMNDFFTFYIFISRNSINSDLRVSFVKNNTQLLSSSGCLFLFNTYSKNYVNNPLNFFIFNYLFIFRFLIFQKLYIFFIYFLILTFKNNLFFSLKK